MFFEEGVDVDKIECIFGVYWVWLVDGGVYWVFLFCCWVLSLSLVIMVWCILFGLLVSCSMWVYVYSVVSGKLLDRLVLLWIWIVVLIICCVMFGIIILICEIRFSVVLGFVVFSV